MERRALKVGELAARTGLSIRTLHYYDEIGLLSPLVGGKGGTAGKGGHRLYGPREIERLQRISSLRALGWSLDEIRKGLDDPAFSPLDVLERHAQRLDDEVEAATRLRERLRGLARRLRDGDTPDVDALLESIDLANKVESYYSEEQLGELRARREEVGEARIEQVQREWQELFDRYRDAMAKGLAPSAPEVLALARRSAALVEEFTGGDPGLRASLGRLYASEPDMRTRVGADPALWEYMGRATVALREAGGA